MSFFWRKYTYFLANHTYKTQCATAGLLWFAGDFLAQHYVLHRSYHNKKDSIPLSSSKSNNETDSDYSRKQHFPSPHSQHFPSSETNHLSKKVVEDSLDLKRLAVMTLFGSCLAAPACTLWYSKLDYYIARWISRNPPSNFFRKLGPQWRKVYYKVIADMFLFEPPILGTFFLATGFLSGESASQVFKSTREQLLPTYLVDLGIWIPLQIANFRFCPVPMQPIVVYGVDVGWNAYLSFVKYEAGTPSLKMSNQEEKSNSPLICQLAESSSEL